MSGRIFGFFKLALTVIPGNALYAAGVTFFVVPSNLVPGGFTGLSIAISHFVNINVSCAVRIFHSAALIAGAVILGKSFSATTAARPS